MSHHRGQANVQPGPARHAHQVIADHRLVVGARGIEPDRHSARRDCCQGIDEGKGRIGADQFDRLAGVGDQVQDRSKPGFVRAAIQAEQIQAIDQAGTRGDLPGPVAVQSPRQPVGYLRAFDPHHHVVPGKVVVGKIDPANPRGVVDHQQLLVIAQRVAQRIATHRVGDAHRHPACHKGIEQVPGRGRFGMQRTVARQGQEGVVDHVAGVIVDQNAPRARGAGDDGAGHSGACGIAFKGHRLDQHAVPRGGNIGAGALPEFVRADGQFNFCRARQWHRCRLPAAARPDKGSGRTKSRPLRKIRPAPGPGCAGSRRRSGCRRRCRGWSR